jgi:hypothetical protein
MGPGTTYGISRQVYWNDVLVVSNVTQISGRKWGKFENYHYMIDSSVLGVEGTAQLMAQIVRAFEAAQSKQ